MTFIVIFAPVEYLVANRLQIIAPIQLQMKNETNKMGQKNRKLCDVTNEWVHPDEAALQQITSIWQTNWADSI